MNDDKTKHLNHPARTELARLVGQFADDLVAEAGRLEANVSSGKGDPEITSSMVRDANTLLRRGYTKTRRRWPSRIANVASLVGGVVGGLMADAEYLRDQTHLVAFVAVVGITAAATVAAVKE